MTTHDVAKSLARIIGVPVRGNIVDDTIEVFMVSPTRYQNGACAYTVVLRTTDRKKICTVKNVPVLGGDFKWPLAGRIE